MEPRSLAAAENTAVDETGGRSCLQGAEGGKNEQDGFSLCSLAEGRGTPRETAIGAGFLQDGLGGSFRGWVTFDDTEFKAQETVVRVEGRAFKTEGPAEGPARAKALLQG